jgi:penicillin amidase
MMFPGIPIVLVGRNDAIAWGGTNMRSASSDLYALTPEQARKCTTRREKIRVRWWPDKQVAIRTSMFGPIISDSPLFKAAPGQTLALRWVGHQASDEMTALLKVNRAHTWAEFYAAFETYAVSGQNFLYADTAGHIGMVPAVKIPVRNPGKPDDFIFDAGSPSYQWNGYLKATEIPPVFDPQQHFIASANNRPLICQPPLGYFFSANDRVDRMTELVRANSPIDLAAAGKIQQDVLAPSALKTRDCLLDKISALLPGMSLTEKEWIVLDTLRRWDGRYTPQSGGALAFQLMLYYFIQRYYGQVYDDAVVKMFLSSEHANTYVQQDLNSGDPSLVTASLIRAIRKASKRYAHFNAWGDIHRLQLKHILGNIPLLGARYQFGDYPARGSYNTVQKTAHQISDRKHGSFYGANARFIARMIDPDENYFVLLGGQDGSVGSKNFIDQVPLWLEGKYIRIPLGKESIRACFTHQMKLQPNR